MNFSSSVRNLLIALGAGTVTACAPIVSSVEIINADVQIDAAQSAGAHEAAAYEFTAAKAYLEKAREESGYSDFEAARRFAEKALHYAQQAREKADAAARAKQPVADMP